MIDNILYLYYVAYLSLCTKFFMKPRRGPDKETVSFSWLGWRVRFSVYPQCVKLVVFDSCSVCPGISTFSMVIHQQANIVYRVPWANRNFTLLLVYKFRFAAERAATYRRTRSEDQERVAWNPYFYEVLLLFRSMDERRWWVIATSNIDQWNL